MIKCLIIEDEFAAQQILTKKIRTHYANVQILSVIDNKDDAVKFLNENEVELVFMDVQIKGGSGLDVLEQVTNRNFETIFITAYDSFAIQALNSNASYYLLKPLNNAEFLNGVDKVLDKILKNRSSTYLLVPDKGSLISVQLDDIIYLQSDGAYTIIVTSGTRFVSSRNLGYYEKLLSPSLFIRTHHSYIVSINKIKSFKKGRTGILVMADESEVPVAQRRIQEVREYFRE